MPSDDDDDDDMFMNGTNIAAHRSLLHARSGAPGPTSDSDSDSDAGSSGPSLQQIAATAARRGKKGRKAAASSGGASKRQRPAAASPAKSAVKDKSKDKGATVFEIDSDDDIEVAPQPNPALAGASGRRRGRKAKRGTVSPARETHRKTYTSRIDLTDDTPRADDDGDVNLDLVKMQALIAQSKQAQQLVDGRRLAAEAEREANISRAPASVSISLDDDDDDGDGKHNRNQCNIEQQAQQKKQQVEGDPIVLKFRCGDKEKKMRLRSTAPLIKAIRPFCDHFSLDSSRAALELDGDIVGPNETAVDHDLENDSLLDILIR